MRRRQLITAGLTAAVVATGARPARAEDGKEVGFVGTWFSTIEATDAPIPPLHSLITFHPHGVVTESLSYFFPLPPPLGNLLFTTFHGAWERTGERTVEAFLRGLAQNASTGALVGVDNVRLSLRLNKETGLINGSLKTQLKATDGSVLLAVTGKYSATPVTV